MSDPQSRVSDAQHEHNHQQPSARWCFVCGVVNPAGLKIKFFSTGPHQVMAHVTLTDEYQSYPGVAHGGILATILDETMGRAILADEGSERFMFTAKLDVRFRKAVPLNTEITATGRIDTLRGRTAQASGEIVLPDGTVAVEGSATLVEIPAEQVDGMLMDDVGWQVYP